MSPPCSSIWILGGKDSSRLMHGPPSHSMKSRSPGRIEASPGALPYQSDECLAPVLLRDRTEVKATYDTATAGEPTGSLRRCRRRDALVTSMTTMKPT